MILTIDFYGSNKVNGTHNSEAYELSGKLREFLGYGGYQQEIRKQIFTDTMETVSDKNRIHEFDAGMGTGDRYLYYKGIREDMDDDCHMVSSVELTLNDKSYKALGDCDAKVAEWFLRVMLNRVYVAERSKDEPDLEKIISLVEVNAHERWFPYFGPGHRCFRRDAP